MWTALYLGQHCHQRHLREAALDAKSRLTGQNRGRPGALTVSLGYLSPATPPSGSASRQEHTSANLNHPWSAALRLPRARTNAI